MQWPIRPAAASRARESLGRARNDDPSIRIALPDAAVFSSRDRTVNRLVPREFRNDPLA